MNWTYAQMVMGTIAFLVCAWRYIQAVRMSMVARRKPADQTLFLTLGTLKRREILHMIKCFIVVISGAFLVYWLKRNSFTSNVAYQIVMSRSLSFTLIAFLIMINTFWDEFDRKRNAQMRATEWEFQRRQKRKTDPNPGAVLEERE